MGARRDSEFPMGIAVPFVLVTRYGSEAFKMPNEAVTFDRWVHLDPALAQVSSFPMGLSYNDDPHQAERLGKACAGSLGNRITWAHAGIQSSR